MRVHVLVLRDQYDSDLLGVFEDPESAKSAADRRFAAAGGARWCEDGRGGHMPKLGSDGAYLALAAFDVGGARP
jgi:hypothetical protein